MRHQPIAVQHSGTQNNGKRRSCPLHHDTNITLKPAAWNSNIMSRQKMKVAVFEDAACIFSNSTISSHRQDRPYVFLEALN